MTLPLPGLSTSTNNFQRLFLLLSSLVAGCSLAALLPPGKGGGSGGDGVIPTHSVELSPGSLNYDWQLDYDREVLSVKVQYVPKEEDGGGRQGQQQQLYREEDLIDGDESFKGKLELEEAWL